MYVFTCLRVYVLTCLPVYLNENAPSNKRTKRAAPRYHLNSLFFLCGEKQHTHHLRANGRSRDGLLIGVWEIGVWEIGIWEIGIWESDHQLTNLPIYQLTNLPTYQSTTLPTPTFFVKYSKRLRRVWPVDASTIVVSISSYSTTASFSIRFLVSIRLSAYSTNTAYYSRMAGIIRRGVCSVKIKVCPLQGRTQEARNMARCVPFPSRLA